MKKNISIILLSFLAVAFTFASIAYIHTHDFKNLPNYISLETKISGLEAGTKVSYIIEKYSAANASAGSDKFIEGSVNADENGIVKLPFFQPDFKKYNLVINDKTNPIDLHITYNNSNGLFNIKGTGFEKFSNILIEKNNRVKESKTDWAGLFSDDTFLTYKDFNSAKPVKFALQGFALDQGVFDNNPVKLEVVIGQGGGPPGDTNVNVYNPVIHDYACGYPTFAAEPEDMFYVSTCDASRVESPAMEEGTCTGGPPCTSSADGFVQLIVHPLMLMGEQLSAVMMQQMMAIGSLIDAKEQNEAQRDFRLLVAKAHKDYHPSEQMCRFGTYVRSISQAEEKSEFNKKAFNEMLSDYYRAPEHMTSSEGYDTDVQSRLLQFKELYCNPNDHGGALWEMCRGTPNTPATNPTPSGTPAERRRYNNDIDYFQNFMKPLVLDVDYTNAAMTEDEIDLFALAKNLYWMKAEDLASDDMYDAGFDENYPAFMSTRQINSMYSLAHNSFATIVGLKSKSENPLAVDSGPAHMKSLLRVFGLSDPDIEAMYGTDPSYYAQMEVLSKKIYQNPTFYTNLYDKPVNVERINASLQAFQLMHYRDRFESQLRQEMLTSMLVEDALMDYVDEANAQIRGLASNAKTIDPQGF